MQKFTFWMVPVLAAMMGQAVLAENYFVSPSTGDDAAAGTEDKPFKTLRQALAKMQSGDTCYLKQGIYRENNSIRTDNLTIKPYQNDFVEISGCALVTGSFEAFTLPSGVSCWRTAFIGKPYDLFINGEMANLARFPNKTAPMTSNLDWSKTFVHREDGRIEFKEETPANFADYSDGYYVGVHTNERFYNRKGNSSWFTFDTPLLRTEGTAVIGDPVRNSSGYRGGGYGSDFGLGYIIDAKAALDAPNEWYSDGQYLYVIFPQGVDPATARVEVRTTLYGMTLQAQDVTLENLHFKAASLLVARDHNVIDHCSFRYITPFIHNPNPAGTADEQSRASQWGLMDTCSAGVYVLGNGNKITGSYFAGSWSAGLTLDGNDNLVENTIVEDVDWMARRNAGISSFGAGNVVRYCTIRNTGGPNLEGGNGNWLYKYNLRNIFEHNLFQSPCRLVVDQAFVYVNHQKGYYPPADTIIRYNIGRDSRGPEKDKWSTTCVGIYIDNNSSGYLIHHNVLINACEGMRFNDFADGGAAGRMVHFYNNTIYQCDRNFMMGLNSKFYDADVRLDNNISFGPSIGLHEKYGEKNFSATNYEKLDPADVVDAAALNFKLQGEAAKLQAVGVQIYSPALDPDAASINYVGAMDPAQEPFKAGATISVPDFAAEQTLLTQEAR